ncbi:chemotaxis protein CheA [Stutzerimonas kunmingensis]|uniref:chemotaxis protein CheA n=1 Tax=Stutzerimonas kunmingensis TaxID=1211807 RepID=UPI00241EC5D3|nr:chemotaxis protein CheA [Stutzerimonas kunmingensis]
MSFDADEEILQDFLVEAGEILELLSEQLVELESSPDDMALLNAIFRGFHTVKGGAGFLQLHELVECCHIAENVFDILRKGERRVDSELMDVVLQALDAVNEMFSQVRERVEPTPASRELLAALARLAEPASADEPAAPIESPVAAEPQAESVDAEFEQMLAAVQSPDNEPAAQQVSSGGDEITDDEFESLLDQLHGKGQFSVSAASAAPEPEAVVAPASDEITDDEFEALLDQLHGKGKFEPVGSATAEPAAAAAPATNASASDEITDDEFEALLDQLHGKGKFEPAVAEVAAAVPSKPEPKPEPARAAPAKAAPVAAVSKPAAVVAEKAPAEAETTVRVDTARLDEIMNMVGELVLVRNRLVRLGSNSGDEAMAKAVSNLDVVTADLQSAVMKTRMQPIKKVFGRFPRLVRDLARSLKKEINLELVGEETDLDKNLVEALADPLVHLVRNAVDHGIEMPEEREAAGKPRTGRVVLSAEQEGDHILLIISDDGKGMDANVLRAKAVEKGMLEKDAADRLSDLECYNLIFAPGFSTKTEISDVSGRGVGMDVVKTKISQLNGTVNVFSTKGQGSRVVIKVPLTLAIMPTLMVMLGNQAFAFPLVNVNEIFHLDLSRTNVVDGQEVVIVRDKALPLFYLKRWLVNDAAQEEQREGHVVILSVGNQSIGFVVDQLVGQEEVVIKPLGKMLQGTPGMSGATITGDGRIALILDVPSMLKRYARRI